MKLIRDLVTSKNSIVPWSKILARGGIAESLFEAGTSKRHLKDIIDKSIFLLKLSSCDKKIDAFYCQRFYLLAFLFRFISVPVLFLAFRIMSETCFANCALRKENTKLRSGNRNRVEWWIVLANRAIDRVRWFSRWNHDYLGNYTVPVVRGLPDLPRLVALLPWTGGSERVPCIRVNCLPEICIKSSSSSFRGSLTGRVPLSVKIPDAQPDIGVIFSRSFTADCVYLLKMPTILTKKPATFLR